MNDGKINQGLAETITSFVFGVLGVSFLLPSAILWAAYGVLRKSESVSPSDLLTVREIDLILILVFGIVSALSGIAALLIHAKSAGIFVYDRGEKNPRYDAGKSLSKAAYPLALIAAFGAILLTSLACLSLYGVF
jgi:hypothetical protein